MTKTNAKKKHLGHKDPYKQLANKYNKVKDQINNPPKDDDVQEIPKKLKAIANFGKNPHIAAAPKSRITSDLLDTSNYSTKIGKYEDCPKAGRPMKPPPAVRQRPGEPMWRFMQRVYTATRDVIEETKFEEEHKLEIRKDEQGKVTGLVPYKDIDELMSNEDRKIKEKKMKKKLLKQQQTEERLREHRAAQQDELEFKKREDHFMRKEKVKFGEVIHRPPNMPDLKSKKKQYSLKETQLNSERLRAIAKYRHLKQQKRLADDV